MTESHLSHNPWPELHHGREKSLGEGGEIPVKVTHPRRHRTHFLALALLG